MSRFSRSERCSSYLRQPGPARGSPHPGRSLFRELSLSYSGEMDLGRSLLGWGTKQGAHSQCPVSWELLNWSCVCSGDLNSTRGPLFCFFLSLWKYGIWGMGWMDKKSSFITKKKWSVILQQPNPATNPADYQNLQPSIYSPVVSFLEDDNLFPFSTIYFSLSWSFL